MRAQLGQPHLLSRAIVGLCAALVSVAVAACATNLGQSTGATAPLNDGKANSKQAANGTQDQVRIAMLLPLKGFDRTALIAKSMKQAGEMALFENDNPAIQLIVKNDGGTADGARAAAEAAMAEGAQVVLGPLFSDAVKGAAQATRTRNVPIIAFSNDRSLAGGGVYLMSFLIQPEVERIVGYASSRGKRRFAALISDDDYGNAVEAAFRQSVARAGGTVVALERYSVQANSMLEPAKKVFDAVKQWDEVGQPIDALFLPGGQDVLPQIGPLLAYSKIDTRRLQLIGTGAWEFPNIGRDQAFIGGWYPGPDPAGWRQFSARFAKTFGNAPPRIATLAYDAVNIAIALSGAPAQHRFSDANITQANGFNGVDGPVRFGGDGRAQRGLAILEVQKFGSQVVDPAPASLAPARRTAAGARFN